MPRQVSIFEKNNVHTQKRKKLVKRKNYRFLRCLRLAAGYSNKKPVKMMALRENTISHRLSGAAPFTSEEMRATGKLPNLPPESCCLVFIDAQNLQGCFPPTEKVMDCVCVTLIGYAKSMDTQDVYGYDVRGLGENTAEKRTAVLSDMLGTPYEDDEKGGHLA